MHTRIYENFSTFSDFLEQAMMEMTVRLEQSYNAGEPWKPIEAGKIPTGHPMSF